MTTVTEAVETHHRTIILFLLSLIAVFLAACSLHDVLPICHYVFGCDHSFHGINQ
jgi:hypothetical protein